MTDFELAFLILILSLVSLLSPFGTGGMDTQSRALATPATPVAALPQPTFLYFWAEW